MKRLIFIGVALALVLGLIWVPAVAAVSADIIIHKTIGPNCPEETFHFEAWRDMNGNGVIDAGDTFQGEVDISGAGTGVITVSIFGKYIIHEELEAGSVYEPHPDQLTFVTCDVDVYFDNVCEFALCDLVILKTDTAGDLLPGSCFTITPDPWTGTDSVTVCDNDANDQCPEDGILCLIDLICGLEVTVEETTVPDGYVGADPQPAIIGETPELTFVNTEEKCELTIYKEDGSGDPLAGACFTITPDPRTGADSLVLCDNDANDECPEDGVFCLSELICGLEVTVEETTVPDGYVGADPQPVIIGETVELTFVNTEEKCELTIFKVDGSGDDLAGSCFTITPDPWTGTDSITVCDNDSNDNCPEDGILCLSELICGLECEVEETTVPDGYQGADPQTVTVGETVELTFVNTREMDCGTVCAAQTAPGEFLFSDEQNSWFTWIYYDIGWGTEGDPYTYPIYTGQTHLCGTLYVYDDGTHIFVNYALTNMDGCTLAGLSEYHLQVDETFADLEKKVVNKGGEPVPGKCEYKDDFDPMVSETGWIECTKDNISDWTTAYIFAHGVGCYYCP